MGIAMLIVLVALGAIVLLFIMRALGAWMLRIDDVIAELREIKALLKDKEEV